ncbi:MAG: hypothetical protein AAFP84_20625, partial [Actinomycetota bacterium]
MADDAMAEGDGASDESTADADDTTVTVTDVVGEKAIPVTDQGVYALDELTGTLLLTLDVQPATATTFFQDPLLA